MIGGNVSGARNIVSGNTGDGIYLADNGTDDNIIWGPSPCYSRVSSTDVVGCGYISLLTDASTSMAG